MGTGRPRGGRLPSEAFVGSRSDPPQHRFWQELTQHTQQVEEGGVSLSSTTQKPTEKEREKWFWESTACLLPCDLCLASAAWLLLHFPGTRRTTGQHCSVASGLRPIPKICVPVPAGSVAGQYQPVHTSSWSARASPGG